MKRIIDWLFRKQFLDGVRYGMAMERKLNEKKVRKCKK